MKRLLLFTILLSAAVFTKTLAQDTSIFPKGEIATVDNHTGTVWPAILLNRIRLLAVVGRQRSYQSLHGYRSVCEGKWKVDVRLTIIHQANGSVRHPLFNHTIHGKFNQ